MVLQNMVKAIMSPDMPGTEPSYENSHGNSGGRLAERDDVGEAWAWEWESLGCTTGAESSQSSVVSFWALSMPD